MKKKEYGVYVYDAEGYEMELARHTDQAVLEALVEHLEELVDPETIEAYIFPVDSPASETSAGTNPVGVPAGVHDFKEGETWAFLNLGGWYSTN